MTEAGHLSGLQSSVVWPKANVRTPATMIGGPRRRRKKFPTDYHAGVRGPISNVRCVRSYVLKDALGKSLSKVLHFIQALDTQGLNKREKSSQRSPKGEHAGPGLGVGLFPVHHQRELDRHSPAFEASPLPHSIPSNPRQLPWISKAERREGRASP